VTLAPNPDSLALDLPYVENSCQVFANGRLIGQIGSLPPRPAFYVQYNSLFRIPTETISGGHSLELAFRVWLNPTYADSNSGGLTSVPGIGDAAAVDEWRQLQIHDRFWRSAARSADVAINIFTALAGIALFLLRRREREHLWWGVSQGFWAAYAGISLAANFFPTRYSTAIIALVTVNVLAYYFQFLFYVLFLHQRRAGLFWIAVVSTVATGALNLGMVFGFIRSAAMPTLTSVLGIAALACVVGILAIGARRRKRDAAILLIPNCVMLACNVLQTIASLPQFYTQPWAGWIRHLLTSTITWPFNVGAFQMVGDLEMLAVLVILVRHQELGLRDHSNPGARSRNGCKRRHFCVRGCSPHQAPPLQRPWPSRQRL
jgi:hypothetical protein